MKKDDVSFLRWIKVNYFYGVVGNDKSSILERNDIISVINATGDFYANKRPKDGSTKSSENLIIE